MGMSFFFYHVGPKGQPQVIRLHGKMSPPLVSAGRGLKLQVCALHLPVLSAHTQKSLSLHTAGIFKWLGRNAFFLATDLRNRERSVLSKKYYTFWIQSIFIKGKKTGNKTKALRSFVQSLHFNYWHRGCGSKRFKVKILIGHHKWMARSQR